MSSVPLNPTQVAALLASLPGLLRRELDAWPPDVVAWHPAPGEWCLKEVLGHLIEAERRGFAGRIRVILSRPEGTLTEWDQALVARERRDCARDAGALLRELAELREDSVTLVAALTDADLDRSGVHPKVGRLAVRDLLHEWVHHDRNHVRQVLANLQAFAWPHMGNAQRFSET